MSRRKPLPIRPLPERLTCWEKAGLTTMPIEEWTDEMRQLLPDLLRRWVDWYRQQKPKRPEEMYCFIYYDIEHDKIRRLVARVLEKEGCIRVQKSVFVARLTRKRYRYLAKLLQEIQQLYENNDSIMMLPVGEDMLNSLLCIGQNFQVEMLTAPRNTIFV